jgi:lysophospholipase L1-like esterase
MKRTIILLITLFFQSVLLAQEIKRPFWDEVQAFKKQDSISPPPPNAILFTGSSSFTLWKDVQTYFPHHTILNRGFGGSSLTDLVYYTGDVIYPYQPKQIVIYCGENDFAGDSSLYPAQVAQRFMDLFELIRQKYPKVPVAYVSMKPSPSRRHLMAKFNVANVMIRNFLKKKKRTAFIDVYHAMLKEDKTPMTDIFLSDNLHMNKKGYDIWQKIIEPYLVK